jgi:hypothetical protein
MAITAATPKIIPRAVKMDLNRLAKTASRAILSSCMYLSNVLVLYIKMI